MADKHIFPNRTNCDASHKYENAATNQSHTTKPQDANKKHSIYGNFWSCIFFIADIKINGDEITAIRDK